MSGYLLPDLCSCNFLYNLSESTGAVDLDKLSPDYAEIVQKMHVLTQFEQLAVMDFVQKYWSNDWGDKNDFDEFKSTIDDL